MTSYVHEKFSMLQKVKAICVLLLQREIFLQVSVTGIIHATSGCSLQCNNKLYENVVHITCPLPRRYRVGGVQETLLHDQAQAIDP